MRKRQLDWGGRDVTATTAAAATAAAATAAAATRNHIIMAVVVTKARQMSRSDH